MEMKISLSLKQIKLIPAAILGFSFALIAFVSAASAQSYDVYVDFSEEDLQFSQIEEYDLVEIEGEKCSLSGYPGEPWLPVRDVHVLLPLGKTASDIRVSILNVVEIDGTYYIYPSQKSVPLSDLDPGPFIQPIPGVYSSSFPMPGDVATLKDTVVVRGYYMAIIRVYPVVYIPADGKLFLNTKIRIDIELEDVDELAVASLQATEEVFEDLVEGDVVNPEDMESEYAVVQILSPPNPDDVKYLIICDQSMVDEFGPLLSWKTQKGVPAEAVSTSYIYSNYSGVDNQEKIKNCIKDYVDNKGTIWVLLGGDNTIVPDRDCFASVNGGAYQDPTIPTDLYYSCLDDVDWDDDNDGVAAEVGEDTIDLGPDVFVGRFPIRTASQVTAIVNKTLDYEKDCPASNFAEKMILCGDRLWNTGDAEAKSESMFSSWIDPYWGPGHTRFYDTGTDFPGGASYDLTRDNLNTRIGNGFNFLHMATHGNTTIWGMESGYSYSSSYALVANNLGKYVNVLTIACITNAFDRSSDPCLSEGFLRNPSGGGVTYIGCSRYGWGYATMSSHGTSFKYDRMFYQFLFSGQPAGYPQRVGAVYAKMKEYWAVSSSYDGSMRWCQFGINLMGDPELCLYTANPSSFSVAHPAEVLLGASSITVDTDVSGALVCLYKENEVYEYGLADVDGRYTASISTTTSGTITVTVTAPNYRPYEDTVTVLEYAAEDNYEDNDFLAQACDISSSDQVWLSSIDGMGTQADEDWYLIDAVVGIQTIVVDCSITHAQGNVDVGLFDSSGVLIDASESLSDNEQIDSAIPGAGAYYIRVYGDNSSNVYDLSWRGYGQVAALEFSQSPGTYDNSVTVAITCPTESVQIYYTTDGSEPTEDSTSYSGPVTLTETATLKARAFKTDLTPSDIISGDYDIYHDTYPLTVSRTGKGRFGLNGKNNLVRPPYEGDFDNGSTVRLYPFAASGYVFNGWTDDTVRHSKRDPIILTMDSNKNIILHFKKVDRKYELTIKRYRGYGSVAKGRPSKFHRLPYKLKRAAGGIRLYPKARRGYEYIGWRYGSQSGGADYPVVLNIRGSRKKQNIYIHFRKESGLSAIFMRGINGLSE